ncbi:MAG: molybdopterin-dependent oxidoreductase [Candidatus Sulfotelmatobacter sp.]
MKKRFFRFFILLLFSIALQAAFLQCQQLTIQPETGKPTVLSRADIEALPHSKVTTAAADSPVTFDVVTLKSVLERAGITFDKLSGKRLASCLLVEAADGYRVVIALPELDPAFTDKQVFLAFSKNGKPLDEKEGPYRIVIPDEKRMARWVRQVTTLKIVDVN